VKVLFIGDINARGGRELLARMLPGLRREHAPDLVVANAENAAHGLGLTPKIADELFGLGIDVMTGGNHLYDKKEIFDYLPDHTRLLRPANMAGDVPGASYAVGEVAGVSYFVATLVGRTFMQPVDCPFRTFDRLAASVAAQQVVRIIDFHAEATSEKIALGRYIDGRASAVIGTHTHVQTADEQILPGGTAYITDVGMTGPHDSVIGVQSEIVIQRFLTGLPARFEPAEGGLRLQAVVVDIDEAGGRASSIERINRGDE
jgi:metallophosphoesterase (TIGR00282 family)